MAKATVQSVKDQSEKLHARWMRDFAGKPRHTRDLDELETIIEKTATLAKKAKGLPGEKGDEVEQLVLARLALYRKERDAIAEAKYERPEVAEIHALGMVIERGFAVWRRHFAGRDRRTRDLGLLDATIAKLAVAIPRLTELGDQPEVKKDQLPGLQGQLELMKDERAQIEKLRREMALVDKPLYMLSEAQANLDRYRVHFAGQARATTQLATLDTILANLERLSGELKAISAELAGAEAGSPEAEKRAQIETNLALITQHLGGYHSERALIAEAHEKTSVRDRTNLLGAAANQMFQVYQKEFAGKERASRDLKLLSDVCDRLTDLAEQMVEHDQRHQEPINAKNIPIVEGRLRSYEGEWVEISKAKAALAQAKANPQAPVQPRAPVPLPGITIAPKKT